MNWRTYFDLSTWTDAEIDRWLTTALWIMAGLVVALLVAFVLVEGGLT